jgi:excinuclease ABC subunit A
VLVIEHHLDMIKSADWVIDMGPEGGKLGGLVIAQGTPEDVANTPGSFTGQYLRPLLPATQPMQAAVAEHDQRLLAPSHPAV